MIFTGSRFFTGSRHGNRSWQQVVVWTDHAVSCPSDELALPFP